MSLDNNPAPAAAAPDTARQIAELERRLARAEADLAIALNLRAAPGSGLVVHLDGAGLTIEAQSQP